jgi:hypothetical protein
LPSILRGGAGLRVLARKDKENRAATVRLADNNAAGNECFAGFHGAQSDRNAQQNQEPLRSKILCAAKRKRGTWSAPRSVLDNDLQLSEAR